MKETKFETPSPDPSWLAKLSDTEYSRLKERYADWVAFSFKILLKETVKMHLLQDDEFNDRFTSDILEDLIVEGAFSKKAAAQLRKELKVEE